MKRYIWDVRNASQMGQYLTSVESDFIDQCLEQAPNIRSILDVGGGSGRFAIPLAEKGYKVTLVEVRPLPLWWLKARNPHIDALLVGSEIHGWPIKNASMDCILAIQVPIIKFDWFWGECYRVLKPGGVVITCMANRRSYKGVLYQTRPLLKPFLSENGQQWAERENAYGLSAQDVLQMFQEYHFQLDQILGYSWLPVGRASKLPMIPLLATIEQKLGLRNLAFQSPWVLLKATRGEDSNQEALPWAV